MRIVFKKYLVAKIQKALHEASLKDMPVEKIVLSKDEARQLEFELGEGNIILGFKYTTLFGETLEVE